MYIFPNTTVKLCAGVPLDNTYTDTVYFGSSGVQYSAISGYAVKTFTSQSYQRVNKNTIRLYVNADDIYNVNYMMFQNTAYGNKWFYAFVTSVDYINDNVSEIHYEIDDLQTWFFEVTLGDCFVEREHSATDVIGEHTAPEPVDVGALICRSVIKPVNVDLSNLSIGICYGERASDAGGGAIT